MSCALLLALPLRHEAARLAASLLAAIVEGDGVLDASRLWLDEALEERDNSEELIEFRQDQLGNVAPVDGDVVKWCDDTHVYCSACHSDHREVAHASAETVKVSA